MRQSKITPIIVSVGGSLRFADPRSYSKKLGRPARSPSKETAKKIRQIAGHLFAGRKPRAIAREVFQHPNEEIAYNSMRVFLHRHRRQIEEAKRDLMGHLFLELADSLQDVLLVKRGRPPGKLMPKTLQRIEGAARLLACGLSKASMSSILFPDLAKSHEARYSQMRSFISRYRSRIEEMRASVAPDSHSPGPSRPRRRRK